MQNFTRYLLVIALLFTFVGLSQAADVVHQVAAGTDGINTAYAAADSADIIELTTSGGQYIETDSLVILPDKPITIRAAEGLAEKPIWTTTNTQRLLEINDDVYLQGIVMTGIVDDATVDVNDSTKYAIRVGAEPVDGFNLMASNVDFTGFMNDGEGYIFRDAGTFNAVGGDLAFENCTFSDVPSYAIRMRDPGLAPASVRSISLINCSAWDIGSYFIRADMIDTTGSGEEPFQLIVDHCTFNDLSSTVLRLDDELAQAAIMNSIFTNTGTVVDFDTCQAYFAFNDTLNVGGFAIGAPSVFMEQGTYSVDPGYADAANADFTLGALASELLRGPSGLVFGALNWDPQYQSNGWLSLTEGFDGIIDAYDYGFEKILLTTSGGEYTMDDRLKVKRPLYVKGADAEQIPTITHTVAGDRPFEPRDDVNMFWLENLRITGTVSDGEANDMDSSKYAFRVRSIDEPYSVVCYNVTFDGFMYMEDEGVEGYAARFDGDADQADSVVFRECTFTNIYKHALRFEAASPFNSLIIENCTFANLPMNDAVKVDEGTSSNSVYANHVTFADLEGTMKASDGVTDSTIYYDAFAINGCDGAVILNSIFYKASGVNSSSAINATVDYCDYFPVKQNAAEVTVAETVSYDLNPNFADAANYDFTPDALFKSVAGGNDGYVVGDTRWGGQFTSVGDELSGLPTDFALDQNYPNPFNAATVINYALPKTATYELSVYNIMGQRVATLVNGVKAAGYHKVSWNAGTMPSGIYFYRLQGNGVNLVNRMVLVK